MKAAGVILLVLGLMILFLGLVFLIGGRPVTGVVIILVGGSLAYTGLRRKPAARNIIVKRQLELSGDVELEDLQCRSCGAGLSSENVSVRAGAVFVACPFCNTEYQLEEAPKW